MQETQNMTLGEQINKTCDEVCQVRFHIFFYDCCHLPKKIIL